MQNILFTPPADQKILSGEKTMTARCWKRKPPRPGEIVSASTGYKKETRFATLRITGVWGWDGEITGKSAREIMWTSLEEIAKREGFETWDDFIFAYYSLNAENFKDDDRQDYFIAFELEEVLCAPHTASSKPAK